MSAICRLGTKKSTDVGLAQVVIYRLPAVLHGKCGRPHRLQGDHQKEP